MFWLYVFILAPIVYFSARKHIIYLLTPRSIPDIPAYPDPSPFFGDYQRFKAAVQEKGGFTDFFDQCSKELGPICQVRLGFLRRYVIISDHKEVETLMLGKRHTFDRSVHARNVFNTLIPKAMIALPTNDLWKHHRRIIGPAMTTKYLTLTVPRANESVTELVKLWHDKGEKSSGRSWSAARDLEGATLDAICGMSFGHSWQVLSKYREQVNAFPTWPTGISGEVVFDLQPPSLAQSTYCLFESLSLVGLFPQIQNIINMMKPNYRKHYYQLQEFLRQKIQSAGVQARAKGGEVAVETADNTLDMMVARELRGEDWLPEKEMIDELFQYLVAGTETSAITLSWWVKYMATIPAVQVKLRNHLIARIPEIQDRQLSYDDLSPINTPYLEAVVHETLRLSRTVGSIAREVLVDTSILGKVVPKGSTLIFTTGLGLEESGGDRRGWAPGTGCQFDPERWLDGEGKFDHNAGPSIPFSLGQRSCFGKNLALLELRLFMAQLNQNFFFAPIRDNLNGWKHKEMITSRPLQSYVRPVAWNSEEAQLNFRVAGIESPL